MMVQSGIAAQGRSNRTKLKSKLHMNIEKVYEIC